MNIIDAHTHLYEKGLYGGLPHFLSQMHENGIEKAIAIALPNMSSNSYIIDICEKNPGKISGIVYPELSNIRWKNKLRKNLDSKHIVGIKIHPRFQKIELDNSKIEGVFNIAEEFNMPVEIDIFPWGRRLDSPSLTPFSIHPIAQTFRQVPVIVAHCGAPSIAETMLLVKSNRNVYLDISLFLKFFQNFSLIDDFVSMCKIIGPNRFIYGSDFPEYSMKEYLHQANWVLKSIKEDEREKIFSLNAKKIFQLDDQ